jgi:hypothetical protein
MVQQFCVENVYFLLAVEDFESKVAMPQHEKSSKNLRTQAQDLYYRFCDVNSNLCVNISSKARSELMSNLAETDDGDVSVRADLFDVTKEEIIKLICEDPFKRFGKCQLYTSVISAAVSI